MKEFTTPGVKETKAILLKMKVTRNGRAKGRAALEGIKARLECNKDVGSQSKGKEPKAIW